MDHAAELLAQVARLTRVRDRDLADRAFVVAMRSLMRPRQVNLYDLLGPLDGLRCVLRVSLGSHPDALPECWSEWDAWEDSEPLAAVPQREAAYHVAGLHAYEFPGETRLIASIALDSGQRRILEMLAPEVGGTTAERMAEDAIAIYCNFANLLDYGERDTLTQLLNRKSFDEAFFKAIQRAVEFESGSLLRSGQRRSALLPRFWLAVIDIDYFKRVNDEFGHLIGDEVLLLVAGVMRASFRHDDRLYRFGGEEFVVLLRADDAASAKAGLERFRSNVESFVFPQVGGITVSAGYTELRVQDSPTVAFERADRVVYAAKQAGRNRAHCYEEQLAEGSIEEKAGDGGVDLF